MNTFLYLLRRPPDKIPSSLFSASENPGDVVLLEAAATSSFSPAQGTVHVLDRERDASDLTYEGLVDKIFETDRVMVI